MRKLLLFTLFLVFGNAFAAHIIGGEMRYEYVGPGTAPNTKIYRIIMILFKGDATGPSVADLAPSYVFGIFNNDNNQKVPGPETNQMWRMNMINPPGIQSVPIVLSTCLTNPPVLAYTYARYSTTVQLPDNVNGYTVAHQTCCRQVNMANVVDQMGANYSCVIPGLARLLTATETDNSPAYNLPISVICFNSPFTLDFSATDSDGDSLVYTFCDAWDGGRAVNAGFDDADPPPYNSVTYRPGFTSATPLGPLATINTSTGIISGTAPAPGNYVVCVCIQAWRNGRLITTHRKDLLVRVSPCVPTNAVPSPGFITCDGFNIQFAHNSTNANTVEWDFGDPSSTSDVSNLDNPVYVYPDTGIYTVKFWINKGTSCSDSATIQIGVYPGFFPGFLADAPYCIGQPIQFTDTSLTAYGVIDSWSWNFGDGTTIADTSHLETPQYVYNAAGNYTVSLTVTNSKGCTKTITKDVTVQPSPVLNAFPVDTTYCSRDTIQLNAVGTGTFSWLPATNIINGNTATPLVFPSSDAEYYVTANLNGCRKTDTVRLHPLNDLTTSITANPAAICQRDTLRLTGAANHGGIRWQWSPAATLSSPSSAVTNAFPMVTTTYTLTATWGNNCVATDSETIPVTALAVPNAGSDKNYCVGQSAIQLNATGGISYSWSPATGLSNPNIPNPTASPSVTTQYIVAVGVAECTRRTFDTVIVYARPHPTINITNDTLICIIDTLRLQASGTGNNYTWSPNYNINNLNTASPLVSPDVATTYVVTSTDEFGCINKDSVYVDVRADAAVNAGNDSTICKGDSFILNATGDAVTYVWSPAEGLSNPNILNPVASPDTTTTYTVLANIGKCEKQSDITIKVAPVPRADAGPDSTVCQGFNAQLHATGGSLYSWIPPAFLSDVHDSDPVVNNPLTTIKYYVTVGDTLGCPRVTRDSVVIRVIQRMQVDAGPPEMRVVVGQPIQLQATGAPNYLWTPSTWLNSTVVSNPVSTPESDIKYVVTGIDQYGCIASDSIRLLVYDLPEGMYVPTAFTPNGDDKNNIFRPILIGMKSLIYFRVYNRFGELVYSTTEQGKGWDGIYNGQPQGTATFAWMAQGETYKGKLITKKGYVVLIK